MNYIEIRIALKCEGNNITYVVSQNRDDTTLIGEGKTFEEAMDILNFKWKEQLNKISEINELKHKLWQLEKDL